MSLPLPSPGYTSGLGRLCEWSIVAHRFAVDPNAMQVTLRTGDPAAASDCKCLSITEPGMRVDGTYAAC
jgi:hypothetical protein